MGNNNNKVFCYRISNDHSSAAKKTVNTNHGCSTVTFENKNKNSKV